MRVTDKWEYGCWIFTRVVRGDYIGYRAYDKRTNRSFELAEVPLEVWDHLIKYEKTGDRRYLRFAAARMDKHYKKLLIKAIKAARSNKDYGIAKKRLDMLRLLEKKSYSQCK